MYLKCWAVLFAGFYDGRLYSDKNEVQWECWSNGYQRFGDAMFGIVFEMFAALLTAVYAC